MIVVLGGTGYVGQAICRTLEKRAEDHLVLSRENLDYTNPRTLTEFLRESRPSFLINAAGYTGVPNVDACERNRTECLEANAVLPGRIRQACEAAEVPWGHISSGCIYSGPLPGNRGYKETDPPNFCFRSDNCSFYSGTKALGEECLDGAENLFVWRLRIPFSNIDSNRNYISKLLRYQRLLDARNSLTMLDEFAEACWKSYRRRFPFGTYNVTNTGAVTTRQVVELIRKHLPTKKSFEFFENEEEFARDVAIAPRSNCILDNSKLRDCGIEMRPVVDAIEWSLMNWQHE